MRFSIALLLGAVCAAAQSPTPLWTRGYSVIPAPRNVNLLSGDIVLDGSWTVDAGAPGPGHIAFRTLARDFDSLHGFVFGRGASGGKTLRLGVKPGTVQTRADAEIDRQAYRLAI